MLYRRKNLNSLIRWHLLYRAKTKMRLYDLTTWKTKTNNLIAVWRSHSIVTTVWQLLAGSTNMQILWFVCLCVNEGSTVEGPALDNYWWGDSKTKTKIVLFFPPCVVCCCSDWTDWLGGHFDPPQIDFSFLPSVYNNNNIIGGQVDFSGPLLTKLGFFIRQKRKNLVLGCIFSLFYL